MGMYTELILGAKLKKDMSKSDINKLKCMIGFLENEPNDLFFKNASRNPLSVSSYYFTDCLNQEILLFDDMENGWIMSLRMNIKNHEYEIDNFVKWLKPYIETGPGNSNIDVIAIYKES